MMTTEPDRPQTTQYYQQQTTDSISFNEVDFNNIPRVHIGTICQPSLYIDSEHDQRSIIINTVY